MEGERRKAVGKIEKQRKKKERKTSMFLLTEGYGSTFSRGEEVRGSQALLVSPRKNLAGENLGRVEKSHIVSILYRTAVGYALHNGVPASVSSFEAASTDLLFMYERVRTTPAPHRATRSTRTHGQST